MKPASPPPSIIFTTPRLYARPLTPADAPAMHLVYGDAAAMRWVGDGQTLSLAQCEQWVEVTERNYATRGYGMFALLCRASGAVIGFCGLVHPGGQPEAEMKYALQRQFWGQGLASEAAAAMLASAAALFGLQHVIATVAPDNPASQKVLLKAGMQRGPLRRNQDGSDTQLFAWQAPASANAR
ncbi:GNAT family N-acetyltransferase [Massilia sp. W12]|uniref:GNAT family N-acetyltransferase n=1 Tax=Massilia sp. W12 TaxID=3126507 RepID=UPI0030CE8E75